MTLREMTTSLVIFCTTWMLIHLAMGWTIFTAGDAASMTCGAVGMALGLRWMARRKARGAAS